MTVRLLHGDCREVMRGMEPDTIDAIVTDPPYELGFMGKRWDRTGVAYDVAMWREAFRVLRPGAHLLAFGGSRTYHRLACAIEDAGFEIRDQIMWIYGSGFPKSRDVSKAIDEEAGAERNIVGNTSERSGRTIGLGTSSGFHGGIVSGHCRDLTEPATEAARQWQGWGTALKPAHEPICMARKPLAGTVAENIQRHGTGALNVDGCRVPAPGGLASGGTNNHDGTGWGMRPGRSEEHALGRWPANIIHDGSDEVEAAFAAFGERKSGAWDGKRNTPKTQGIYGPFESRQEKTKPGDTGTASRFFYCPKASKADRNDGLDGERSSHPTVKPTELMRYLCRLITPPGGTVLDPFAGSGSTGRGAVLEGLHFVGIEMDEHYADIARLRINAAMNRAEASRAPDAQGVLL